MGETPRRLLVADTDAASRALLEPLVRDEGWEMLSVDSSFQVLRTVRDAHVHIVLINPDLPGSGVTGVDVARTLKGASQFKHLPVLFLLHGERKAPAGVPADGSIELDHWDSARIFHAIKQALGLAEPVAPASVPAPEAPGPRTTESLLRPLTDLVERVTARVEAQLSRLLEEQELRFRERAQEFFAAEGAEMIRQEIQDQVRKVVEQAVNDVAREVVPEVAERLIAEEIARVRRAYDLA